MTQNRWLSPSLIVIVLLVVGGLLLQTQRLGDTSTQLESAQVEIAALQVTATTVNEQLRAEATQAAATQAALEASAATQEAQAAATQAALVTQQAQAAATQTAQAAAAATQQTQAEATQIAQAASAATQQAQAEATQVAYAGALDESEANAEALTQDLATQAYAATQASDAASAEQAALQATATLQAEAIETISQDYTDLQATATLVAEAQATLAVDTMATMVALGYREDGSEVPIALNEVEAELIERLERITALIPDEVLIGNDVWTAFVSDETPLIFRDELYGTYAMQSISFDNEKGDFATVIIIETQVEKTAIDFADILTMSITDSFAADLLSDFPEPHFAGLGAYDSLYGGWAQGTSFVMIAFLQTDEVTRQQLLDIALWLRDNVMTTSPIN